MRRLLTLWDCLFLDIGRVKEFLDFVPPETGIARNGVTPPRAAGLHCCRRGEDHLRSLSRLGYRTKGSQTADWSMAGKKKKEIRNRKFHISAGSGYTVPETSDG